MYVTNTIQKYVSNRNWELYEELGLFAYEIALKSGTSLAECQNRLPIRAQQWRRFAIKYQILFTKLDSSLKLGLSLGLNKYWVDNWVNEESNVW